MSNVLSDDRIAELIAENKPWVEPSALLPNQVDGRHRRRRHSIEGEEGSRFRIMTRQLVADELDFSVILAYEVPGTNRLFRLRRHNGDSHVHTNKLEGETIDGFHIHEATERYQLEGFKEEDFARATDAYADLSGAVRHLLETAGFEPPAQGSLLT